MLNLQKLRHLSCICAYCNKVIPMYERTNDHLIPRCAGGETEIHNIVICCSECNSLKGATEVNVFLENNKRKTECFYNYLNMIDYQIGNNEYSNTIVENLSESLQNTYFKNKAKKRAKRLRYKKNKELRKILVPKYNETQNIEYKINLSGKNFYINELQAKILDYYLQNPDFSDYKNLAQELGIGKNRLIKEITCINNLTGVFKLKEIGKNGIVLNNLWCEDLEREIIKSESEVDNV